MSTLIIKVIVCPPIPNRSIVDINNDLLLITVQIYSSDL